MAAHHPIGVSSYEASDARRAAAGDRRPMEGSGGVTAPTRPAAEPRWPMATAVLAATALYVGMPHRGRVPGWWMFPVLQLVLLGLLIAQDPGRIDRRSTACTASCWPCWS